MSSILLLLAEKRAQMTTSSGKLACTACLAQNGHSFTMVQCGVLYLQDRQRQ